MDDPASASTPVPQEMTYVDHVKQRQADKGCLYACLFAMCCCFCCYETFCSRCVAAFVATRLASVVWMFYAVTAHSSFTKTLQTPLCAMQAFCHLHISVSAFMY
ncbi:hypothetical protein LOK49_LG14G01839 [Camellia lanceoleosa]|uniref:Uncharacterized protein n=1 Tax=Camellia lanceoleosa TaxID=1840588 RepID=A0ACC0F9Y4_9ERIC|nr:hypothetical protein LOK49_LG14G01839 [Camellia lanceoleosa]